VTRYLLDTNAFLLFGFGLSRVSESARSAVASGERLVSHVCAIEIAIKHSLGRLALPPTYDVDFEHAFAATTWELAAAMLPIDVAHIALLNRLPFHHRDPFDRLLIAQAIAEGLTVVSRDRKFALYPGLSLLHI
jgi:PIN domain nuclease of toxin-antitoxin system